MDKVKEKLDNARQKERIAEHMLSITYPLVKDPKLLIAIIENIFLIYTNSIASLLYREYDLKRINAFADNFDSKFKIFKEKCITDYKFDKNYAMEIQNIREIIVEHKKSPVEFKRRNTFVICSENYSMKTVTLKDIQNYLNKAKVFIVAVDNILREKV